MNQNAQRCDNDANLQERMKYLYDFRPVELLHLLRLVVIPGL